jgi:hypothetical protein
MLHRLLAELASRHRAESFGGAWAGARSAGFGDKVGGSGRVDTFGIF